MQTSFTTSTGHTLSFRLTTDDQTPERVEQVRALFDSLNKSDLLRLGRTVEWALYQHTRSVSRLKYGRDQRGNRSTG
jgi:hypothetical protein